METQDLPALKINNSELERQFYDALVNKYGQLISTKSLVIELGFSSSSALRQSIHRKTLNLPTFPIANRRGKFAYSKDVAAWLAQHKA